MHHLSLSIFMTSKTFSDTKEHHKSTKPESGKKAKVFSFFRRANTHLGFALLATFYGKQCTSPAWAAHHFYSLKLFLQSSVSSLLNYRNLGKFCC